MGAGVSVALIYVSGGMDPLVLSILPAILLLYVELMILTGVALLFSSFSSPALSALLTFFCFHHWSLQCRSQKPGQLHGQHFGPLVFRRALLPLPNLANLSLITPAAHGQSPSPAYVVTAILYSLVYVAVVLAAATLIFSRRNFK